MGSECNETMKAIGKSFIFSLCLSVHLCRTRYQPSSVLWIVKHCTSPCHKEALNKHEYKDPSIPELLSVAVACGQNNQTVALGRETFSLVWRLKGKKEPAFLGTLQERASDSSDYSVTSANATLTYSFSKMWRDHSLKTFHPTSPFGFPFTVFFGCNKLSASYRRLPSQEAKISVYSTFTSNVQF